MIDGISIASLRRGPLRRVCRNVACALLLAVPGLPPAWAQSSSRVAPGGSVLVESAAATRVAEKVRAGVPGVVVEVFVRPGETVRKGQMLGHTELDATKLQLDLAEHALRSKSKLEAARSQADAWTIAREETAVSVRRREVEKSRLDWAAAMEKMYQANYEIQIDEEQAQLIQYEYWKSQYEKRFFRSPVDGVVTEVLAEPGRQVTYATHVFTVCNDQTYAIPVTVPAPLAESAAPSGTLPVRAADGRSVARGLIDGVVDDPRATGRKVIRLLVKATDFPVALRPRLKGMKFDVLLPELADNSAAR